MDSGFRGVYYPYHPFEKIYDIGKNDELRGKI